jgi:very-short-patch-repair endonuclease
MSLHYTTTAMLLYGKWSLTMAHEKNALLTTNGLPMKGKSRCGKSYLWEAKCGVIVPRKRDISTHQKQCPTCMSQIRTGPSSGKNIVMYCGEIVKTHKNQQAHFQICAACHVKRREIRVQTCKDLVHTDEMRQKYSEAAKKTSERSDIQEQRATQLKNWRVANPKKFDAIRAKAHASPKLSKMEMYLEPYLVEKGFTRSVRLSCGKLKTLKQVDFVHKKQKIVIEVDGPWHFLPIHSTEQLATVQARDHLLHQEIIRRNWRLIRLSMQGFKGNTGELITPDLTTLFSKIDDKTWTGVLCFGSLYTPRFWDGIKVTILK